ncbi:Aquaporin PIP1-2 [Monoraphidium neglectum]|uniref:Aquaporin PIP1-2 n=1 Tax=Monoraphidium neglectum TaxID=145388 RepID=A0A0D2N341_9CHLO|nr:Aquaporin PIP1-2 [Monoraphidium neglectum]KIZ06807.1 Aquaporin PIP1-2 [Monoraphidium neglectum]|eukprot:XP_013905826.1 Aquaporin PIP1-2 [Monoraphidium neglectum]
MSDGISRIELKAGSAYARYSDEQEDRGLLRTAPDIGGNGREEVSPARKAYDDEGLLPVMIENGLEKIGVLTQVQKVLDHTGQIRNELFRALIAEFMGTLLFQIFGGAAPPKDTTAPAANGFALVAIIYAFANISGAHLNPAVTFSLMCTGHMTWWRGLLYIIVQILGSIFGSLIYTGLIPGLHLLQKDFQGGIAPGCFGPAPGVNNSEVFGWELLMTFLLVMTVYAAAVAKPGHGNTAPLAIGLSLYAAALTGGPYTGASLNPARTIGPACVFACNVGVSFLYIGAEFFGAALAAGLAIFLYGRNPVGRAAPNRG